MLKELEAYGRKLLSRAVLSHFGSENVYQRIPGDVILKRILIMRWDAIGDMVVCLPLFRKIRDLFPEAEVGIVVSRRNNSLLKYEDGFHTILYDSNPSIYLKSIIEAIRFRPDAVVDTRMHYDSTTSFIYGVISGADWRLSASNRDNRLPFSVRVPMPPGRHHYADLTRILLEGLGKDIDESELDREIRLSSEEIGFADAFWREAGLDLRGKAIGINISTRDPLHQWGESKTIQLCSRLISSGHFPILISTPIEHNRALRIASSSPGTLVAPVCPTILHAAALLKGFRIFITPDTGIVHVAASQGVPVVGLYCPNENHLPLWYPWKVPHEIISAPHSVAEIEAGDVQEAVEKLLDKIRIEGGLCREF
ncbi:MAG: glycosyltransferase family 9 protein [Candidatus Aegiribacteria sp.]|nr:glycosyltransferase family 9 protein [Candidatus Aegiribacteria sp.]